MPSSSNDPALLLSVLAGAVSGLLASIVGHVLLGVPKVKVRIRDELHIGPDPGTKRRRSYIKVTNVRGRLVTVDRAFFLVPGRYWHPGPAQHPKGWLTDLPVSLGEGQSVLFTFDRGQYPRVRPVVIDSADRGWPRRWRPLLWWRGFRVRNFIVNEPIPQDQPAAPEQDVSDQ